MIIKAMIAARQILIFTFDQVDLHLVHLLHTLLQFIFSRRRYWVDVKVASIILLDTVRSEYLSTYKYKSLR